MNPTFEDLNFRLGRRQMAFECAKPVMGEGSTLTFRGLVRFALDHEDACMVARQHEREFRQMILTGEMLPVAHDEFPEYNGFYWLVAFDMPTDSSVEVHRMTLTLRRIGSTNDIKFESRLIAGIRINDFGLDEIGDAEPWHAPPPHTLYAPRHTTTVQRATQYLPSQTIYRDIALDAIGRSYRQWAAAPDTWYDGAATICRRAPLYPELGPIHGRDVFFDSFEAVRLENGIVRFWFESDAFHIAFWDGTAWREKTVLFVSGGLAMHTWHRMAILDNRPERCAISFEGGAVGRTTLQVSLRRGDLGVACLETSDAAGRLGVFDSDLTDMTITAGGGGTPGRAVHTSADANGHRLMFTSARSFGNTAADGYIWKDATTQFDAYIGGELGGASTGNQAPALALQYFAALNEHVSPIQRGT